MSSNSGSRGGLKAHLLVLAAFAILSLVITAPLVTCLGSCLGDSYDPIFTVWGFAWIAKSVFGPAHLYDANLFHPYTGTLALSEPSLSNGLLAAPLIAATKDPILGYNVILILQYAGAAFGAYLVVWQVLGRRSPAILAGVLFATSSFLVHNAYNLQSFAVLLVAYLVVAMQRFLEEPSYSNSLVLWSVTLVLAVTSVYFSVYGGLSLLCFLAVVLAFKEYRLSVVHLKRVSLVAPPFLLALGLAYYPYWIWARERHQGRSLQDVENYRATLDNYGLVAPTNLVHRAFGWWGTTGTDSSAAFPGIIASLLASFAVICALRELLKRDATSRSRAVHGLAWAVFGAFSFVMAFGPTLRVGNAVLPLPYRLFFEVVPGMSALRTANRFLGLVTLAVAVLAALGLDRLGAWAAKRIAPRAKSLLVGATAALSIAELACYPYPGASREFVNGLSADHLAFVDWLKARPGPPSVVELPMLDSSLYDATMTGSPFVNGWSSFAPPLYHQMTAGLGTFPSPRALALIAALPVELVVVDCGRYSQAVTDPRVQRLLEPVARFGALQVFSKRSSTLPRDELTFAAHLVPSSGKRAASIAVELSNPQRAAMIALYPQHRLEVTLSGADANTSARAELGLWFRAGRSRVLSVPASSVPPTQSAEPLRLHWKLSASGMPDRSGELVIDVQRPSASDAASATP